MIKVTFPDGNTKEYKKGTTVLEVAQSISQGLAKQCVSAQVNDALVDMSTTLTTDCTVKFFKAKDKEGIDTIRHSAAHLLAMAIEQLFPYAKITIGPVVENGFYYDIDHAPFTPEDLEKLEAKMKELSKQNIPIERIELSKKQALDQFKDNEFKVEIITELPDKEIISAYKQGTFIDLCRGPHVQHTGQIEAFKLTKMSGAYWRGDAANKQLQRIYGVAFADKKELAAHLTMLEEAQKRDHRVLGKNLELFMFHQYSPGAPFLLPKGHIMYRALQDFIREQYIKRGFNEVMTPNMFNSELWKTSGHWEHYSEDMFTLKVEGQDFALKPMNCPSHCLIYRNDSKSYKDLPLRIADFGALHRNELSGALGGMTRVRKFCQDDAHIFCSHDQIESEIDNALQFVDYVYKETFGMEYEIELSTRPEKFLGSKEIWDKAEESLANAIKRNGKAFEICEGDGAFYGPKIDFRIKDCLGRIWQTATIQLDFNLPERFELEFEGSDSKKHRPVMIHRAVLGSLERFMAILIEHYAGKFPLWINPVQVKVLTIVNRVDDFAQEVADKFKAAGIRVECDFRAETLNKKVREAQLEQVNYILVVGEQEKEKGMVNIRTRDNKVLGTKNVDEFMKEVLDEIKSRK